MQASGIRSVSHGSRGSVSSGARPQLQDDAKNDTANPSPPRKERAEEPKKAGGLTANAQCRLAQQNTELHYNTETKRKERGKEKKKKGVYTSEARRLGTMTR